MCLRAQIDRSAGAAIATNRCRAAYQITYHAGASPDSEPPWETPARGQHLPEPEAEDALGAIASRLTYWLERN